MTKQGDARERVREQVVLRGRWTNGWTGCGSGYQQRPGGGSMRLL